ALAAIPSIDSEAVQQNLIESEPTMKHAI
ncbi:hypothetical protein A2U01_0018427, partial [Trifolium medium]|nr:hypothetical protein [Trifolium medium]